jgi:ABC-type transport system involved in cytochrome c biogenesis permease subunit
VQTTLAILNGFLPLGYLLVLVAYLGVFVEHGRRVEQAATPLAWGIVLIHGAYLMISALEFEHVPTANTWESLTFIAFAMTLVYLVLEWRQAERSTGVFIMAAALLFQTLSSAFITHTRDVPEILRSSMFAVHVTAALMGYVALAVSAVYGVMYLLQYRQLKKKNVGLLFQRLPNLETLSRLNIGALGFGWLGLTVAIIAGTAWATRLELQGELQGSFLVDPKFLLTFALWVLYGLCLGGRYLLRWANRTLAAVSIVGFTLMLASSLTVTLVFRSFHDFS